MNKLVGLLVMICAAILEIGGNAVIRRGMREEGAPLVAVGFVVLGGYGIIVNRLPLEFSRTLGAYVGLFDLGSVLFGRVAFAERVSTSTWIGLGIVLVGSAVIHFGEN